LKASKLLILILIIVILFDGSAIAQKKEQGSLYHVLQVLEKRLDVVFTYLDETVEGYVIKFPSNKLDLENVLLDLHKKTGLEFKNLNQRYIVVSKAKTSDIQFSGVIKDKTTQLPIEGAVIYSRNNYVLSDDSGQFKLSKDQIQDSVLIVKYIGYKPIKISYNDLRVGSNNIYFLSEKTTNLQEVIIKEYIAKGINKNAYGSIQLNVKNIEALPGLSEPDILHTLQVLPGLQSINETVSEINIRGGTNDQNLVLWDGVKVYQAGHFFGLISAFNSYLVSKATVTKNGTSAAWGDAVSGTIDLQLKDRISKCVQVNTGFNMLNADFIIEAPISKSTSIQLSARRSISDLIDTPTYKNYFDRAFDHTEVTRNSINEDKSISSNQNFKFHDFNFKFLYDISEKDKLEVGFLNIHNSIDYKESELIDDIIEIKTSGLEQSSLISNFNYSRLWNNRLKTSVFGYVSYYNLNAVNFDISKSQRLIQQNEVQDIGLRLKSRYTLSPNFVLLNGYQFSEIGIRNLEDITIPNYREEVKNVLRTHALYTEGNLSSKSNNINLRFGLRANYYQDFSRLILEPRFAFNLKFFKYFSLEVLAETKSQHTSQITDFQTDFLGVEKRRWVLSNNKDIPITTSKQLSLGVHYQKRNLLVAVEAYIKDVKGIISSSQGFHNEFEFIRTVGGYDTYGMELLINKRLNNINLWFNYSLAENNYRFEEFTPSYFPSNLDISNTLTLGASYKIKNLELSAGYNYHTGKPYTPPVIENPISQNEINYQEVNSNRLNPYIRLDVSMKYRFSMTNKIHGFIGFSLWNALNRKNVINTYFHLNEANELKQIEQEALRMTPNLNLRINF